MFDSDTKSLIGEWIVSIVLVLAIMTGLAIYISKSFSSASEKIFFEAVSGAIAEVAEKEIMRRSIKEVTETYRTNSPVSEENTPILP